jgi:hypothetical protein
MSYIEELEKQNEELQKKLADAEYRILIFEKQEADRLAAMQQAHENINKQIFAAAPRAGKVEKTPFQFANRYSPRIYLK